MATFDPALLQALRGQLRGPAYTRDSDAALFDESCTIWNGMVKTRPAIVARPTGTADVAACVRFAREHGLPIAPKGGGHNLSGTSMADGGLTVDLSRMRAVLVDPVRKLARVQGGALLGDVDRETQVHGLAAPLGFVSETGVGGLTLGGGFGYLTRRYGWACDNLVEVELVVADGRVVRTSAEENADLFWAVRGGGGNFGIATTFTFRLHEVGPTITGGLIAWPGDQGAEVFATYAELTRTAPRELTMAATARLAPAAPFVPPAWHGKPAVLVVVCHTGSEAQAEADLAPLRRLGTPIVDLVVRKPYAAQQALLDATQPKGFHYYWKSEFLPALTQPLIDRILARGHGAPTPQSQALVFHIGGAIAERAPDDGAVGNRDAEFVLGVAGAWAPDHPAGSANVAWVRETWEQIRPYSTGGVYVNFLTADEGDDRIRAAYGANYTRLARTKAAWDPTNLFRSNKNVAPQAG
jgi:FAD/FMN-containing dehydrogenase